MAKKRHLQAIMAKREENGQDLKFVFEDVLVSDPFSTKIVLLKFV